MSNDPFNQGGDAFPQGNDPYSAGNEYPAGGGQPPKKSKTWLWVIGIILGLGFLGGLLCCGATVFFARQAGGLSMIFEPVRQELNQMPEVTDEIGPIKSMTMNFGATTKEAEQNPEFIVFDLEGESGSAQVSVKVGGGGGIDQAILILPDGTRKPLDPSNQSFAPSPVDEFAPSPLDGADVPAETTETTSEDPTDRELRELESALDLK